MNVQKSFAHNGVVDPSGGPPLPEVHRDWDLGVCVCVLVFANTRGRLLADHRSVTCEGGVLIRWRAV